MPSPHLMKVQCKSQFRALVLFEISNAGCGDPGYPGVYGETWEYMSWISATTGLTGNLLLSVYWEVVLGGESLQECLMINLFRRGETYHYS